MSDIGVVPTVSSLRRRMTRRFNEPPIQQLDTDRPALGLNSAKADLSQPTHYTNALLTPTVQPTNSPAPGLDIPARTDETRTESETRIAEETHLVDDQIYLFRSKEFVSRTAAREQFLRIRENELRRYEEVFKKVEDKFSKLEMTASDRETIHLICSGKILNENKIREKIEQAIRQLQNEKSMVRVSGNSFVFGDIHGDLTSLFTALVSLEWKNRNFVFLGDYVDRGLFSVETLMILNILKTMFPQRIFLLRGNHECRRVCERYGMTDEISVIYGKRCLSMNLFQQYFEALPVAAVINSCIFCVHGGISREFMSIEELENYNRFESDERQIQELLWSDPSDGMRPPTRPGAIIIIIIIVLSRFVVNKSPDSSNRVNCSFGLNIWLFTK